MALAGESIPAHLTGASKCTTSASLSSGANREDEPLASKPLHPRPWSPVPRECPSVSSPLLDVLPLERAAAFIDAFAVQVVRQFYYPQSHAHSRHVHSPTPTHTSSVQAALGSLAGQQYTIEAERGDNLFHLVLPVEGVPAASQSSVRGGAVNFHTEDPLPPIDTYQPRSLTLLMLRVGSEAGVHTALAPLDDCAADLLASPGLIEVLSAPQFTHPVPDVFSIMKSSVQKEGGGREDLSLHDQGSESAPHGSAVLYTRDDDSSGGPVPCICLQEYTAALDPNDATAAAALVVLRRILTRQASLHKLQPGEMLESSGIRTDATQLCQLSQTANILLPLACNSSLYGLR